MKSVYSQLEPRAVRPQGCLPAQKAGPQEAAAGPSGAVWGQDRFNRSAASAQEAPAPVPASSPDWGQALWGVLGGPLWKPVLEPYFRDVGTVLGGIGQAIAGLFGGAPGPQATPGAAVIASARPSAPDASAGGPWLQVGRSARLTGQAVAHGQIEQEVAQTARRILEREPRPEELAAWTARAREVGAKAFSAELAASPEASIVRLYKQEVGRPIDAEGRANWLKLYEQGESLERIEARLHDIMARRAGRA